QTMRGLRAVTIMVDPISMLRAYGLEAHMLPKSLLKSINTGEAVIDKLIPRRFGMIAADIIARRGMFPSAAQLYYEGKTLELISTLLNQLARRDAMRFGDSAIDPRRFERLEEVKKIIDRAPHRALGIDALARVAAMNRTKLRSWFKQVYGTT